MNVKTESMALAYQIQFWSRVSRVLEIVMRLIGQRHTSGLHISMQDLRKPLLTAYEI